MASPKLLYNGDRLSHGEHALLKPTPGRVIEELSRRRAKHLARPIDLLLRGAEDRNRHRV